MADGPAVGTAYLRIAGDFTDVQTQAVGLFKSPKWSALGKAAGAGLAVGIAAGGAAKALYDVGAAFDEVSDTIRTKTGATGKDLRKLEGDFKSVVKSVPTDFASAADAVATLNQRLEITGKPLRRLSKQFTQLALITKTDVGSNIQAVTRAFGDWEVKTKDQTEQLDRFFRASQQSGAAVTELADQVVQFGAPLRQVGFSLNEATAMFAAFEEAGVNTQTMMPGLRFALRQFMEEGLDPAKELTKTFEGISKGTIDTTRAFEIFGGRATPDMIEAVKQGRFELDALTKAIVKGDGTIAQAERGTRDFAEQWTLFTNRLQVFVEPVATAVFKAVGEAMKALNKLDLKAAVQSLKDFWQSAGVLRTVVTKVFDAIRGVFNTFKGFITGAVKVISGILTGDFGRAWKGVKEIFSTAIKAVLGLLKDATAPFRAVAKAIGGALADGFSWAWDKITGIFEGGANALKDIVNWIIKNVINRIPGVEEPLLGSAPSGGGIGGSPGGSGSNADEPGHGRRQMAFAGAKITAPTAIVGEEAPQHPEYVLATNPRYRRRNLALFSQAGRDLGIPGFFGGGMLEGFGNVVNVGASPISAPSAGDLIGKMSGAPFGALPGFMSGAGDWIKDRFAAYIRDKVTSVVDTVAGIKKGQMAYPGVSGDTDFLPVVGKRLSAMARATGTSIFVQSGGRTIAEQAALYALYQSGAGPVAAAPNPSAPHVRGVAADITPGRSVFGSVAARFGLGFTVPSESWHVEALRKGGVMGKGTGLGLGGRSSFNINQLTTLAAKVGMSNPALMAAIAMAESSGQAGIAGDGGDSIGLWQINTPAWPQFSASRLRNPIYNAKAAKAVLAAQGLSAWSVYNSGAYRQFLGGNVIAGQSAGGGRGASGGGGNPQSSWPTSTFPDSGTLGYQHLPSALKEALGRLRTRTGRLDEKIANAQILDAMASSPAAGDLSEVERTGQIGLNQTLLDILIDRVGKLKSGIHFAPKGPRAKRLRDELVELQGITGKGGRILDVRATLDSLGVLPESAVAEAFDRAPLLEQLLAEERRTSAIIRAQSPVFGAFNRAPYGGSFANGGVVPGPQGAPRTIVASGGETITPAGGMPVIHNHFYVEGNEIRGITRQEIESQVAQARASGPTLGQKARIG